MVDIINKWIFKGEIYVEDNRISKVWEVDSVDNQYILPGFIDAYAHIERSMLMPSDYARITAIHGNLGAVCDINDITGVLGVRGIEYMVKNGSKACYPFHFLEPDVNAGPVNSGRGIAITDVEISDSKKAAEYDLIRSFALTSSENLSFDEVSERLKKGDHMVLTGGLNGNYELMLELIDLYPDQVSIGTGTVHATQFESKSMQSLVKYAISNKIDVVKVLRAASYNTAVHYHVEHGFLREGDSADMIVVNDLEDFKVENVYSKGSVLVSNGNIECKHLPADILNHFDRMYINTEDIETQRDMDYAAFELSEVGSSHFTDFSLEGGKAQIDKENDILKVITLDRFRNSPPVIGFLKGLGLTDGAIASSYTFPNFQVIAAGTDDKAIKRALNLVIKNKGGLAYVSEEDEHFVLPLPIAGLMSPNDVFDFAPEFEQFVEHIRAAGVHIENPFLRLAAFPAYFNKKLESVHFA